jgi:ArsR family transcriptional regulator
MNVLDVIGNESRRRILELLAKKPCYLSEISYYLGMAPKVVIEHLEKLEKTGIVSSFEDGRRRYYYIGKSLRIEVTISPHLFDVEQREGKGEIDPVKLLREAEQRMFELDIRKESISDIFSAMRVAEEISDSISTIQSAITAMLNEMIEELLEEVEKVTNDDLERLVLLGIAKGLRRPFEIAEHFKIPYREVEDVLESLRRRGVVKNEEVNGESIWVMG